MWELISSIWNYSPLVDVVGLLSAPFPWAPVIGGLLGTKVLGDFFGGRRAERTAKRDRDEERRRYNHYLNMFNALNQQKAMNAGSFLSTLLSSVQRFGEVPKEFLAEAERIPRPAVKAMQDLATGQRSKEEAGAEERIKQHLKRHTGLPGGTEAALVEKARESIADAGITARTAAGVQGEQMRTQVDTQNVANALQAAMGNLQAVSSGRNAQLAALASGMGPYASLLTPFQLGPPNALPESAVGPNLLSSAGNAGITAMMLYKFLGGDFGFGGGGGGENYINYQMPGGR